MTVEIDFMDRLSVKNVKKFDGHEGPGFSVQLYLDGSLVAYVTNEGNGGCYSYNWLSRSNNEKFQSWAKSEFTKRGFDSHGELDMIIEMLVNEKSSRRKIDRWATLKAWDDDFKKECKKYGF